VKSSEQTNELSKALSKMQGEMGPAKKDKVNPFFKSSYADLPSIWSAIREPLADNGLCVMQDACTLDIGVSITTRLSHVSGQWVETGPLVVPVAKNDAQAVGSALSYGKRYSLGAILGVVAEIDDDGNKAVASPEQKISKEQVVNIEGLLKDREDLKKKILSWAGIKSLRDLSVPKYKSALISINKEVSNA
jgi:hypothetical protein